MLYTVPLHAICRPFACYTPSLCMLYTVPSYAIYRPFPCYLPYRWMLYTVLLYVIYRPVGCYIPSRWMLYTVPLYANIPNFRKTTNGNLLTIKTTTLKPLNQKQKRGLQKLESSLLYPDKIAEYSVDALIMQEEIEKIKKNKKTQQEMF